MLIVDVNKDLFFFFAVIGDYNSTRPLVITSEL